MVGAGLPNVARRVDDGKRLCAAANRPKARHPSGAWALARGKTDPVVQARCIGAVKQGSFVLAVVPLAQGNVPSTRRSAGPHGGGRRSHLVSRRPAAMQGCRVCDRGAHSTIWPHGRKWTPRGLASPVPAVAGIEPCMPGGGTSGCARPCRSARSGTAAYVGTACALCEVVPGILNTTEESGVLGLPRLAGC